MKKSYEPNEHLPFVRYFAAHDDESSEQGVLSAHTFCVPLVQEVFQLCCVCVL
jgi:hypothetical protein